MVRSRNPNQLRAQSALATVSFAAVIIGLWWERPSLALILPGAFVFSCLSWSYLTSGRKNA